jgi:hypothetical protein
LHVKRNNFQKEETTHRMGEKCQIWSAKELISRMSKELKM